MWSSVGHSCCNQNSIIDPLPLRDGSTFNSNHAIILKMILLTNKEYKCPYYFTMIFSYDGLDLACYVKVKLTIFDYRNYLTPLSEVESIRPIYLIGLEYFDFFGLRCQLYLVICKNTWFEPSHIIFLRTCQ